MEPARCLKAWQPDALAIRRMPASAGPLFVCEKMDEGLLDQCEHNQDWQERYLHVFASALDQVFNSFESSHCASCSPQLRRLPAAAGTLDREYEITEDTGEIEDLLRVEEPPKTKYQSLAMQVQAPWRTRGRAIPEPSSPPVQPSRAKDGFASTKDPMPLARTTIQRAP